LKEGKYKYNSARGSYDCYTVPFLILHGLEIIKLKGTERLSDFCAIYFERSL